MTDMPKELLSSGNQPAPGATHEANATPGEQRDMIPDDQHKLAATHEEILVGVDAWLKERGDKGIFMPLTKENFPNLSEQQLTRMREKHPHGIPEISGGQEDSTEMLMNIINAFQAEKPFDVTLTSANMRAIVTSLAIRYGQVSAATKLLKDRSMIFPGFVNQQGQPVPTLLTRLATLQQIVTTSAVPAEYRGVLIEEKNGQPAVVDPNFLSPPQLVRELRVNDPDHGDQFVLAPFVPEKLEPFVQAIQKAQLGAPRQVTLAEIEASRRQTSNHFAMINLTKGLAGSLSQHDMLELQRTADRIMAGSHDETPVFKLIGMVPQVHAMLASDKIEALAQFYETHLTETRIFHAMRTTALAVGMQVRLPGGNTAEVSGTLALGDFMDQLLSSQKQLEQVMQGVTDAGPRMGIRGMISAHPTNEGVVAEEGKLIWQVIADRLGMFDQQGNWVSLKSLLFGDRNPTEMKWEDLANCTKNSVLRTNIPDIEVMMPLTKESLGVYPIDENVPAALYPLYLCAREFSRGLLLDMMMAPDFQGKAGKQVRKLRRWVYDVWTYWQGKTGLNELQKTFPYKDFISERLIPALIEKVRIEEVPNWKQTLRAEVARRDGVWLDAFDQYDSYTKLAKDVIATVFTNPTLLPSRMPKVEGYITALALNTSSTTRTQKLEVYRKYLQDDFVSKGQMGMEEFNRRVGEFEKYLDYWRGGGPIRSQYDADMTSGRFPRGFTLEQWLKHRITNERYASRSQRSGTLRTKEEMKAAYATLTEAEMAVLEFSVGGRRLVKFAGTPDKPGITDSMGISFSQTEGLFGLGELVEKFAWRNFPINFIPPRLVDGTSVGGYISDFVNLTTETSTFTQELGSEKQQQSSTQLPFAGENIDVGQTFGLMKAAGEYLRTTYHFVPYPHQRERALEFWKILLWSTTPLKSDELITASWRAIPKGADKPTHQEMFVPVNLFHESELQWLKGIGMRGSSDGGKKGMIFLGDYPARFRLRFGDIKHIFQDMKSAAERCQQPLTVIGMERPNYNTLPWKPLIDFFQSTPAGNELLYGNDVKELQEFAGEHLDPTHKHVSEMLGQKARRIGMDVTEVLKNLAELLPKA